MIRIRAAIFDDVEWLLEQVTDFSKFYGASFDLAGDKEYARTYLKTLILNHFVRISENEKERTGLIAGLVSPHHFNPQLKGLHELLWWVPEAHRQSGSGKLLLDAYMAYGEAHCDFVTFTLEDNSPVNDSTLIRRGFRLKEKAYIKEIKPWQR